MGARRPALVVAAATAAVAVALSAGAARSAQATTIVLHPGPPAVAVPLPVSGGIVQVTVSGMLIQDQGGGVEHCWDAFWHDNCSAQWQDPGTSDSIWLVPPGWSGGGTQARVLTSALAAGSTYPALNQATHVYHVTLNLTGKQGWSLFAVSTSHGGPVGTTQADWSGSFSVTFGAGSTGGQTVTKLATGSAPFGTPVNGTVAVGGVVDTPSPSLPPSTTEVDASAQFTDAEIDQVVEALKVALAAYNRRKALEALSYWCLVFVPQGDSQSLGLNNFAAIPGACDKYAALILKKSGGKSRYLSALKAGCAAAFVPFWKPGSRVTAAQHAAALTAAKSEVQASCTGAPTGRLAFRIVARGKTTLNQVLGRSVPAAVGAGGKSGTAQLTVTWAKPKTRGAAGPPGKAAPGHYTGTTNAAGTIAFDVTADGTAVTNLTIAGPVDCTDTTSWNWTISSPSSTPISPSRTFTRSYSGALEISSSTISNIQIAYTLSGTFASGGSASGKFQVTSMSWDDSSRGKHYSCTGALTSWTARAG